MEKLEWMRVREKCLECAAMEGATEEDATKQEKIGRRNETKDRAEY